MPFEELYDGAPPVAYLKALSQLRLPSKLTTEAETIAAIARIMEVMRVHSTPLVTDEQIRRLAASCGNWGYGAVSSGPQQAVAELIGRELWKLGITRLRPAPFGPFGAESVHKAKELKMELKCQFLTAETESEGAIVSVSTAYSHCLARKSPDSWWFAGFCFNSPMTLTAKKLHVTSTEYNVPKQSVTDERNEGQFQAVERGGADSERDCDVLSRIGSPVLPRLVRGLEEGLGRRLAAARVLSKLTDHAMRGVVSLDESSRTTALDTVEAKLRFEKNAQIVEQLRTARSNLLRLSQSYSQSRRNEAGKLATSNDIVLRCQCGTRLRTSRDTSGKKVRCLNCGRTLVFPNGAVDPEEDQNDKAEIRVNCGCGTSFMVSPADLARMSPLKCPTCQGDEPESAVRSANNSIAKKRHWLPLAAPVLGVICGALAAGDDEKMNFRGLMGGFLGAWWVEMAESSRESPKTSLVLLGVAVGVSVDWVFWTAPDPNWFPILGLLVGIWFAILAIKVGPDTAGVPPSLFVFLSTFFGGLAGFVVHDFILVGKQIPQLQTCIVDGAYIGVMTGLLGGITVCAGSLIGSFCGSLFQQNRIARGFALVVFTIILVTILLLPLSCIAVPIWWALDSEGFRHMLGMPPLK